MSLRETIKVPEKCQQYLNAVESDSENSENSYDNSSSHHRWHSTNKAELWTENYIVKIYSFIH